MKLKSPTNTKRERRPKKIAPVHPGEVLRQEVLKPRAMSVNKLARSLGVPTTTMRRIVVGRRPISPDTALRLARFLGTTPEYWMRLQAQYDLNTARDKFSAEVKRTVSSYKATA